MGITHVIRGEDLIDTTHRVLALRAALGGGRAAGVRAPAADPRRRPGEAVEAPRRGRGRGVPRPRVPPRGARELPRAARLGTRRRRRRDPVCATSWWREFDLERVTHASAVFDPKKLDWMNGEWIRRLDLDELAAPGASPTRGRGSATDSIPTCSVDAVAIGQERVDDARAARRPDGVPVRRRRRVRDRARRRGRSSRRPNASPRCSTR